MTHKQNEKKKKNHEKINSLGWKTMLSIAKFGTKAMTVAGAGVAAVKLEAFRIASGGGAATARDADSYKRIPRGLQLRPFLGWLLATAPVVARPRAPSSPAAAAAVRPLFRGPEASAPYILYLHAYSLVAAFVCLRIFATSCDAILLSKLGIRENFTFFTGDLDFSLDSRSISLKDSASFLLFYAGLCFTDEPVNGFHWLTELSIISQCHGSEFMSVTTPRVISSHSNWIISII